MQGSRVPAHKQRRGLPQVGGGALPGPSVRCASCKDGWGPHFRRKGVGPEREVMRHLIRGGGGLLPCGSGGQGGAGRGRVAAEALDAFTTLPSRGCHTLPGHKGPQDLHIRYTKITSGWVIVLTLCKQPSPLHTSPSQSRPPGRPPWALGAVFLSSLPNPL